MKLYKFNDTIIFLKGNNDPIFGSIIFSTKPTSDEVIIKSSNDVIRVSLKQIKVAIFRVTLSQYGFIFNESLYSDDDDINYWDKQTEMIARHKLKPNLNKLLKLRWQSK